jgi:hypothetical protein
MCVKLNNIESVSKFLGDFIDFVNEKSPAEDAIDFSDIFAQVNKIRDQMISVLLTRV